MHKPIKMEHDSCPSCGKTLDAATDLEGNATPKPNDISICLYCGSVNLFGDDLKLRQLTFPEYMALQETDRADISRYVETIMVRNASAAKETPEPPAPSAPDRGKFYTRDYLGDEDTQLLINQMLMALVLKAGGSVTIPVHEVDATGGTALSMLIDHETKTFTLRATKAH